MRNVLLVFSVLLVFLSWPTPVKAADYTLFARHLFNEDPILPDTVPNTAEIQVANSLTMFASRGEYESTTFAIYNNGGQTLEDVEVSIPSLTSGQHQIGQEEIDIRVVKVIQKRNNRYNLSAGLTPHPEVLIPYTQGWIDQGEFGVPAGESKQWWITVKVNIDTTPGIYTGTIQINPINEPAKTIPIELKVSPAILLTNPKKVNGFWYHPPQREVWSWSQDDPSTLPVFREALRSNFALMKEMGLQTVTGRSYTSGSNTVFLRAFFEEAKNAGLGDHPMFFMTLGRASDPQWLLEAKSLSEEIGIPELYWMITDEAFQDWPDDQTEPYKTRRDALINGFNLTRSAIPDAKILMTISFSHWYAYGSRLGWKDARDKYGILYNNYIDVQAYNAAIDSYGMNQSNQIDQIKQELEKTDDIGYMYINRANSAFKFSPYDHRIDNGLFLWILPVRGNMPWTYQWFRGDPYNDSDGDRGDHLYAYPDIYDNGNPLPAPRFVGMREGIDDTKYFYTLEEAIRLSNNPSKKAEAQQLLDQIENKATSVIPCKNYVNTVQRVISPSDIDQWRKEIAQLIVDLGQPGRPTPSPTPTPTPTPVPTVEAMMISNFADFHDADTELFATTKSWTLTSGEGEKTVWVKFKCSDGSWTSPVSDTIVLETTGPTPTPSPTTAPTPTPIFPPSSAKIDFNGNGVVDILDWSLMVEMYGQTGEDLPGDFNGDGEINILDVSIFMEIYNRCIDFAGMLP